MTDILSLSFDELKEKITGIGEPGYRAEQIFNWLHVKQVRDFSEMLNLSAQLRTKLNDIFCIKSLLLQKRLVSDLDNTVKYLYALHDGEHIETVFMKHGYGNSLCLSTQVGCKIGCAHCASGIAGFVRNLSPSEMLLQLYETESLSGERVDSIVLMGIGEPLDNYENTLKFLEILSDKRGRNMSLRHVSLSTSGLADKIEQLADLKLGLTLSVSLHAADDQTRDKIVPINKVYNIERLLGACREYRSKTGRRVSFEYTLIDGVNDSTEMAGNLARVIKPLNAHVNLINVNPVEEAGYRKSRKAENFLNILLKSGITATLRRTMGSDIDAACGQLRRTNQNKKERLDNENIFKN